MLRYKNYVLPRGIIRNYKYTLILKNVQFLNIRTRSYYFPNPFYLTLDNLYLNN